VSRFEYRDPSGGWVAATAYDTSVRVVTGIGGCRIEPDRLEEVIAGLRDMGRQAAGRPAPGPCSCGYPDDTDVVHPVNGDPCYMRDRGCQCTPASPTVDAATCDPCRTAPVANPEGPC